MFRAILIATCAAMALAGAAWADDRETGDTPPADAQAQVEMIARPALPPHSIVNAWRITIADAAALAEKAVRSLVTDLQPDPVRHTIRFARTFRNGGFVLGRVEPQLVRSGLDGARGVTFNIVLHGASGVTDRESRIFAHQIRNRLEATARLRGIDIVPVIWPETLPDRTEIALADTTVPRQKEVFEKYIRRRKPDPVEGVWERADGKVQVGIYRELLEPGRVYRAMVLGVPDGSDWQAGEIKFELEMLEEGLLSGPLYGDDRARAETVWRFERGHLVALSGRPGGDVIRYARLGPRMNFDEEPLKNGTGWVASADGHIVTNFHVIEDTIHIRVGPRDGPWQEASVLLADERTDIAILKIDDPSQFGPPLALADDNQPGDGAELTAVGYPLAKRLGEQLKVTAGVVSGQSGDKGDVTRLQHTAALQPGSSGSPVFDRYGHVAAVAVSLLQGSQVQDVNFAIKIGYLKLLLDGYDIRYRTAAPGEALTPEEIAARYRASIVPVWVERKDK